MDSRPQEKSVEAANRPLAHQLRVLLVPLVLLLIGSAIHIFYAQAGRSNSIHARGTDDAYISFRYSGNLVRGEGLVYNPGDRVEGFSNLLHVVVGVLLVVLVGRDQLYLAVSLWNMALLGVCLLLMYRYLEKKFDPFRTLLVLTLLALAPALWVWSASGLETIAVLAVQLWLWQLVERWDAEDRRQRWLPVAIGLMIFVRTDGFVIIALIAVFWIWRRQFGRVLETVRIAAPFLVMLFGARWLYYGELWPNTYHVNVSGPILERITSAIGHLWNLAINRGLLIYIVAALVAFGWQPIRQSLRGGHGKPSFGPFLATGVLAYWLFVGGDHYGERFLLVVIPIGLVILFASLNPVRSKIVWGLVAVVLLVFQVRPLVVNPRFQYGADHYDGWITLGRFLNNNYQDARLAVDAAGKIPFFSDLETIDMRGLTDQHIAMLDAEQFVRAGHNKMDPDYVMSQRPDIIATWIQPDLNAAAGLTKDLYSAAGYQVAWLANATTRSRETNLLDVRGWSEAQLKQKIETGYRLGVLKLGSKHGAGTR